MRPLGNVAEKNAVAGAGPDPAPDHGEEPAAVGGARWRGRLILAGVGLLAVLALFAGTFAAMVETWWRSETFAHGFVIFPISGYLIWRRRQVLRQLVPSTSPSAIVPMVLLGAAWLLGAAADVLGVQQFAVVAMIPAVVALTLGWHVARQMAFPLAFLLLAVPIGEALVPPLIQFTATFTVNALQLTGVPVYWEGARFSVPSGDWSVVKACSGVRYLFATLTVSLLFAYLNFRSIWRRLFFVSLALGLAIFANGVRAYAIVMIGHLSEMRLAVGVDHFIYGWVFFALLMFLIFWIGGFLRERQGPERPAPVSAPGAHHPEGRIGPAAALFAGIAATAVFPAWAAYVEANVPAEVPVRLEAPMAGGWSATAVDETTDWSPIYVNPTAQVKRLYRRGDERVGLHVAYYARQEQGAELINYRNVLVKPKTGWHVLSRTTVHASDEVGEVVEARIRSDAGDLLVWRWYWVDGRHVHSPYVVKAYEALDRLVTGRRRGAGVMIYTPLDRGAEPDEARAVLRRFLDAVLVPLDRRMRAAEKTG